MKYTIEEYEFCGELYTLELDVSYKLTPYDPGCTMGPPENCYPPEGGDIDWMSCTITKATGPNGKIEDLSEIELDFQNRVQGEDRREDLQGAIEYDY